jgi:serine/threonine protein kinase/Tfp pilus assembly protein PilF
MQQIFLSAVEQHRPEDWEAYLDQACAGDDELRNQVRTLLKAHVEAGSVPGAAAQVQPQTSAHSAAAETAGTTIGAYKLIEPIGEGGMGAVWMAQQTEPVRRLVALKLIKAGMDSKRVLARFEAERQALALMDHPNIARVLDAGTAPTGRPYFVMDLVKGVSMTRYCDEHRLTPRQRLELFIPVCQAVQHAHQKGIIHRDLKPSNVLVALYDGKPVPKVIDFGVAKASGQSLTEKTLVTGFGDIVGTLEYMSPEQAEVNQLDIDTRSDIYSLGVLLYELLTGSPPFSRKALEKAGMLEMLRVIREQEPSKPSTKLSTAEGLPTLAANRGTEPAKLTRLVRGELDWIVMKALEKDRGRRYETANGFAQDIQRYLADEPVQACPPSASYRMKKFVRRHKGQVIAAGLVLLALVLGMAGTTLGLFRAEARRLEAEEARAAEAERADGERRAKQEALTAKARAEKAEAETLDSYRASTDDAIEYLIGSKPDLGPRERTYLEITAKRWQAFADRKGDDERARAIRGEGHCRVGSLWDKLGRRDEARAEYERALAIQAKLADDFPAVPAYRRDVATSHYNLGRLLRDLGKRPEAEEHHRQALKIQGKLAAEFPDVPDYRQDAAMSHNELGILFGNLGKRPEAEAQYGQALEIDEKLAAEFPAVPDYRRDLAAHRGNLGTVLHELGKWPEAERQYRREQSIWGGLAAEFPAVPDYRRHLAVSHNNLGALLIDVGKRPEAEEQYGQALKIQEKLVAEFPAVPAYRQDVAMSRNNLGIVFRDLGKWPEAEEQYRQALAIREKLAAEFPAVPAYQVELGGNYCNFGNLLRNAGKPDESLAWFDKAIRTLAAVYEQDRRLASAKQFLRNSHFGRALAFNRVRKYAEAVNDWDRAVELSSPAEQPTFRAARAKSRLNAGQIAEAVAEVGELTHTPAADSSGSPKWSGGQWYDFACVYSVASGKIADKEQSYADRAVELLQQAVKTGYKDAAHMKKNTDLDPLRQREDFQKLVAELEGREK